MILDAQLQLYLKKRPPFADNTVKVPLDVFWQSKLRYTDKLADLALLLHSIPISEAAVERTFSSQKFLSTPLRNHLKGHHSAFSVCQI